MYNLYTLAIKSYCIVAWRYTNVYDFLTAKISLGNDTRSLFPGFKLHTTIAFVGSIKKPFTVKGRIPTHTQSLLRVKLDRIPRTWISCRLLSFWYSVRSFWLFTQTSYVFKRLFELTIIHKLKILHSRKPYWYVGHCDECLGMNNIQTQLGKVYISELYYWVTAKNP